MSCLIALDVNAKEPGRNIAAACHRGTDAWEKQSWHLDSKYE